MANNRVTDFIFFAANVLYGTALRTNVLMAGESYRKYQRAAFREVACLALALSACYTHKEPVLNLQISRPIVVMALWAFL